MKLSKRTLTGLLCLFIGYTSFAQNVNYFATDTTFNSVEIFMKSTPFSRQEYIKVKSITGVATYTPNQITDYGFQSGVVYVSKKIEIGGETKQVFLKRIRQGILNFYLYKTETEDIFYLEKEDKLVKLEVTNNQFREQIQNLTSDFKWESNQVAQINYNKRSLNKIVTQYNFYDNKRVPKFTKYLTAGYRLTSLKNPTRQLADFTFEKGHSIFIGTYVEIPILQSFFSAIGGINFSKTGIAGIEAGDGYETNVAFNLTSFDIPLLLRYTATFKEWRPYANVGTTLQSNLINKTSALQTTFTGNTISVQESDRSELIQNSLSGITIGAGVQYPINNKQLASAEIRYKQLMSGKGRINQNQFEILINYSF